MPGFVFKLRPGAIPELEKSAGVLAELKRKASLIAAHANAELSSGEDGFVVDLDVGKNRARAVVLTATPEAMNAEAGNRTLTRAIDAGRG